MSVKCPNCKRIITKNVKKKLTPVEHMSLLMEDAKKWSSFMKKQLNKNLNKENINASKEKRTWKNYR